MDALDWLALVVRAALALYLGGAAFAKLLDGPENVRLGIADYSFIPRFAIDAIAYAVVGVEIALCLTLVAGPSDLALWLTAGLLMLFAVSTSVELARGRRHGCGCFGAGSGRKIGFGLLAEDVILAAVAIFAALRLGPSTSTITDGVFGNSLDGLLAGLAAVGAFLVLLLWSEAESNVVSFRAWLEKYTSAAAALDFRETPGKEQT